MYKQNKLLSLKASFIKGTFWNAIDKLFVQSWYIVIGILLARLISPNEFGLIGMISILVTLSQVILESGMGTALVQKKDKQKADYSTVFIFNLCISIILYLLLFFIAPLVASFYEKQELTAITRVIGLSIIIRAFSIVQITINSIAMDFKKMTKVNVFAVVISGAVSLSMAYYGFGVWSLVALSLTNTFVSTLLYWYFSTWKVSLTFSSTSFKPLFKFGSKLLIGGIYANIMREVYNVVIGKNFSANQLGQFTKGKEFSELSSGVVSSIIQQVSFPLLASIQEEKERMIQVFSRLIRFAAFIIFPTMIGLVVLADPLIKTVLTEEWYPVIPLLQILCFARIFYPISALNLNFLNANGRSDLFLKVDLVFLPIVIISLIITVPYGIKAMLISNAIINIFGFFIYAFMPGKLYNYGPLKQLKDIFPFILMSTLMAFVIITLTTFIESPLLKLIFGTLIGILTYLLLAKLFKVQELEDVVGLLKLKKS